MVRHGMVCELFDLQRGARLRLHAIGGEHAIGSPEDRAAALRSCDARRRRSPSASARSAPAFADCRGSIRRVPVGGGRDGLSAGRRHQRRRTTWSRRAPRRRSCTSRTACRATGAFARHLRFEPAEPATAVTLSTLAACASRCRRATRRRWSRWSKPLAWSARRCASRRSRRRADDFFAYPDVRTRLTFTAERAFSGSLALVAGVVPARLRRQARQPAPSARSGGWLARAFPRRRVPVPPVQEGPHRARRDGTRAVRRAGLLGVLHLLNDDRGADRRRAERVHARRLLDRADAGMASDCMLLLIGALTIGLILSLLALGVFISFRDLRVPRHHRRRLDHARRRGRRRAAGARTCTRCSPRGRGVRCRRARRRADRRAAHALQDQRAALRHPRDDRALLDQPARHGARATCRCSTERTLATLAEDLAPGVLGGRGTDLHVLGWEVAHARRRDARSGARRRRARRAWCSTCSSAPTSARRCRPPATTRR